MYFFYKKKKKGNIKVTYIKYCTWPVIVVRIWKIGGHTLIVFILLVFALYYYSLQLLTHFIQFKSTKLTLEGLVQNLA